MLLSDNETKIDMLNNMALAKTIVSLICESDERPISIGVHGDWGAGKSSILEMVEGEFADNENGFVCIKFNGWKHQGFEDAKMALMSSIVSELSKNKKVNSKGKEIIKKLWKNINWLSVAKIGGSALFSLATGLPPIDLVSSGIKNLKSIASDKEKVESTIGDVGQFLSDARIFQDNSISQEFSEFHCAFEELLKESEIKKLIVLIDDLDRCLPKVTIETLEAVRLFMFTKSTAFVIAADEAMIEYAVHEHFPNLPKNDNIDVIQNEYNYAKRYLEKLIQVPFKIPALGKVESEMYITLLMICSRIKEDDERLKKLLDASLEKMKTPWENSGLSIDDLKEALGDKYDSVSNEINVATQIAEILANNTQGNPRKIKRFLNMLLLRKQMAEARGFGSYIQLPILAKLMLAEYYFPTEYANIAMALSDDNGECTRLTDFERERVEASQPGKASDENHERIAEIETYINEPAEDSRINENIDEWSKNPAFVKWVINPPLIGNVDLRPYFFACKEREDFLFERVKSEKFRELISKLMGGSFNVASATEEVKELTGEEAKKAFELISAKIKKVSDISQEPKGIAGIRSIVNLHPQLEESLLSLIESFDCSTVGGWIITGWNNSIVSESGKTRFNRYIAKLEKNGNPVVKAAIKAIVK